MSDNVSITKARARKDVLWAIVILCAAMGGVYEYQQATAPLDEATIFVSPTATENTSQEQEKKTEPQAEVKENSEALTQFLGYMDEVNVQVDEIMSHENNVLDHIHALPPVAKETKKDTHIFQDGKIEIYDSERGVVDVVDEGQAKPQAKNDAVADENNVAPQKKSEETEKAVEVKKEEIEQKQTEELKKQEEAEAEVQKKLQQQVQKELQNVAENGEEAPVVLIPGMGMPAAQNVAEDEEVDLVAVKPEAAKNEVEEDMQVIGEALKQIEEINLDDLKQMNLQQMDRAADESMKQLRQRANIEVEAEGAAEDGAVNMLQQIMH